MTKDLLKLRKELKSFAKRVKNFKYTETMLITFLMTGLVSIEQNLFSKQIINNSINNQTKKIDNSIKEIQQNIKAAKYENDKLSRKENLELIQLMEQGDYVIKSPWSNWQYGNEYLINNWNEVYKGYGDKKQKYIYEGILGRSKNVFEREISPLSTKYNKLSKSTKSYPASANLGYGLVNNRSLREPLTTIDINVAIKPKDVQKEPITLERFIIAVPTLPTITVTQATPPTVDLPEPETPTKTVIVARPTTNPFTGFYFAGVNNYSTMQQNSAIYSGVDPNFLKANIDTTNPVAAAMGGTWNGREFEGSQIAGYNNRYTNTYYINNQAKANSIKNNTFYLRGHYDTDTYNDSTTTAHLGKSHGFWFAYKDSFGNGKPDEGIVGVHTVGDMKLEDMKFNLYGRAGAITAETWRHGRVDLEDITINMYNSDNMGFYNMPAARYTAKYNILRNGVNVNWLNTYGAFTGTANVNMYGKTNSAYLTTGFSFMKHWTNEGMIKSEGASNIAFLSYSYSPTLSRIRGLPLNMTNQIKLSNINLYGDENIGIFFGSRIQGDIAKVQLESLADLEQNYGFNSKAAHIGIYQGEIDFKAKIGEQLTISGGDKQTSEGNISSISEYTDETVDASVGIYSESRQRTGIVPMGDIMEEIPPSKATILANNTRPEYQKWLKHYVDSSDRTKVLVDKTTIGTAYLYASNFNFNNDPVHNLEVAKLDVRFGKYSKNGIMVLAKQGTVIDIGKNSSNYHVTGVSTDITDGISGASTTEDDASMGTIIAYAEGTWDQAKHRFGGDDDRIARNDADAAAINGGGARSALTDPTATTAAKLQGLGSEINVNPNVVLASKEGIAYMAENKGIVNAEGTTKAVNYGSIIGYGKNKGVVNVNGTITAIDDNASDNNKYKNIGAFAEDGGIVNINDTAQINGIGAFSNGIDSQAKLLKNDNIINAGVVGGMVAVNNGYSQFNGGTINVSQDTSRLFYADATGKVDFTGATTFNVSKGVILPQEENNTAFYSSKATTEAGATPTKYNGMRNVTINLLSDDVVLKTVNNHPLEVWSGSANFENQIKTIMKYNTLNTNGHTYKVYYTNGDFKIAQNINLDSNTDIFNHIVMGNEKVTVDTGINITSTAGKGLVQGSLPNTINNTKTQYINKGKLEITGGNSSAIGFRVNHGTIENENLVKMNDGVGLYASNGSKILNKSTGKIEITAPSGYGVGIAGFVSGATAQDYGTDKLITDLIDSSGGTLSVTRKTIDITNEGTIDIAGKAVGIYANNTSSITDFDDHIVKENAVVNNKASLSFGDDSMGIFAKKAIINLTGTGTDDISVGNNGIGIYGKDSEINFVTDYGFKVKNEGTGIFAENTNTSTGNMKLKYAGNSISKGIGIYFTGTSAMINKLNIDMENDGGSTKGIIGIYAAGSDVTNEGNITVNNVNTSGFGIIADGSNVTNKGIITLEDAPDPRKTNMGMYTVGTDALINLGKIKLGKNGIGIYGKDFVNGSSLGLPDSTIEVGDNGVGVYSSDGNGSFESGSMKVGKDGIGVYLAGNNGIIRADSPFSMTLGDGSDGNNKGSFGFVDVGIDNKIISNISNVALQNNSIYIYSKNNGSETFNLTNPQIINNTNITASGKNNYGVYIASSAVNTGNMDLQTGTGNVGIYAVKGDIAENKKRNDGTGGIITVGGSIIPNDEYGIGMAAGYSWSKKDLLKPISERPEETTGTIINRGVVNVNGEFSIGMYGSGLGSEVSNYGYINLNADNTTGIYLNDRAVGHNYGTITNSSGVANVTGVVVRNGAKLINEPTGKIILDAESAIGVLEIAGESGNLGIFENYGVFDIRGEDAVEEARSLSQELSKTIGAGKDKVSIEVPEGSTVGTIRAGDEIVIPEVIDTRKEVFEETKVSSIGMYINTSGVKFTNPISGLSALRRLKRADLIIGSEATEFTDSKFIQIGQNIIDPYNSTILNNPQITKWNIYSGSLTWMANVAQNQLDGTIENAYLVKIPYTNWSRNDEGVIINKDTYNFQEGLEQKYGKETLSSRERLIYKKLNSIGNNEEILFYQATDEMMGHQYGNLQQRINVTGNILDNEFDNLQKNWQNTSKRSNKINTFGIKDKYKSDTAGIINYTSNAYGVAYVHEDEKIKMGNSSGWYAGAVTNRFKFKDIGHSRENQTMIKAGILKTISPSSDHNGALQWTVSGDVFSGINDMKRKYLVVDDIFEAKSNYYSYGAAIKNELGYDIRMSQRTHLRPYGSLKVEYGRFGNINEESGQMRLEVKGNHYFSVKPEVGMEFKYIHSLATRTNLSVGLTAAYENELGKSGNVNNKAKVKGTQAGWFGIRGEKEDRTGNGKFDLKVGVDNTRFGVTANFGYETKGKNVKGGIGLRAIF